MQLISMFAGVLTNLMIRQRRKQKLMVYIICIATFLTTMTGGLLSLRFQRSLYLILGFSGGAVIGVALFDLLPTSIELAIGHYSARRITSLIGMGFTFYLLFDRLLSYYSSRLAKASNLKGIAAASILTIHSCLDGVAIGLAFHLSVAIGGVVAAAILIHDFADGMNTANVLLKEKGKRKQVVTWLVINAAAPMIGAASTYFYHLPNEQLGLLLALITGFFLYIGASDFLPDSYRNSPGLKTVLATLAGIAVLYIAVHLAPL